MVQKTTKGSTLNVARTGTHGYTAGKLRLRQEQRTRVLARCWKTLGGLDKRCNFVLFCLMVGVTTPRRRRCEIPKGVLFVDPDEA